MSNNTLGSPNQFDPGLHVSAENYFDLAGTFTLMDRISLRAGINNLFDNDPPRITGGNANVGGTNLCPTGRDNATLPGYLDALGRLLWSAATIDFSRRAGSAPVEALRRPRRPPPPPATQTCRMGR